MRCFHPSLRAWCSTVCLKLEDAILLSCRLFAQGQVRDFAILYSVSVHLGPACRASRETHWSFELICSRGGEMQRRGLREYLKRMSRSTTALCGRIGLGCTILMHSCSADVGNLYSTVYY